MKSRTQTIKFILPAITEWLVQLFCENLKKKALKISLLKTSAELDLRNQSAVNNFFEEEKPIMFFLLQRKLVVLRPIIFIVPNLFMIIF